MMILALALLTQAPEQWITLTNMPGYQGLGYINSSGWAIVKEFRKIEYSQPGYSQPLPAQPGYSQPLSSDPYNFLNWLNGVRAQHGLPAVSHDPNLSNWASQNNVAQAARGMGHHIMGPARMQNSAGNMSWPGDAWMWSPAHRAALLDPTIQFIGIAYSFGFWTYNSL